VDPAHILPIALAAWEEKPEPGPIPDLWDGKAAERILDVLESAAL
jgi:hypothetical protein